MSVLELEVHLGPLGVVRVRGETPQEVIERQQFWRELPQLCPVCGQPTRLVYQRVVSKKPETLGEAFDYYRLECRGVPRHSSTLGQHKEKHGGGLYYKPREAWDSYDPTDRDPLGEPAEQASSVPNDLPEDAKAQVDAQQAGAFFKDMVGHGVRPQEVRGVAERTLKRGVKQLTELTLAELEQVRQACLDTLRPEPRTNMPRGFEGGPIGSEEHGRFEDLGGSS